MAIPTDDDIYDAVQEAGAYGLTLGQIGLRLGVPWQSLTKRVKAMADADEPNRRIYSRYWGSTYKIIYRAVGYFASGAGGRPLQWNHEKNGWEHADIKPTEFQNKLVKRAKRARKVPFNSLDDAYYERLEEMGLVRKVTETDKWTTWGAVQPTP